ncbi:MAG: sigma-70 family RNA polymerase sigma factor [Devosia nanyangense]|uniref:Sigma-70 family RNA polymerase sigma factor n=1 Tax=Devosia nanyangense TaxID=1228055 RepID=A0A933L515_9HYPH|nr:sigma-70 family RNA polymerase sigma factor [Devosia nanyangense]
MLPNQETLALIASYQRDHDPRVGDKLLRQYDRWCRGEATRVVRKFGIGYDLALQAARLGLIEAAERFEPERGFSLMTFAATRTRRTVAHVRAEAFGGPSGYILETRRLIGHAVQQLQAEGLPVNDETIGARIGVGAGVVSAATRREVSMDAKLSDDDGDATLHDVLPDREELRPDRLVEEGQDRQRLRGALEGAIATSLSERNAEIVSLYLEAGCETGAMAAIARSLGLTRQRVAGAISDAMPRLRRALKLNGFGPRQVREL